MLHQNSWYVAKNGKICLSVFESSNLALRVPLRYSDFNVPIANCLKWLWIIALVNFAPVCCRLYCRDFCSYLDFAQEELQLRA